MSLWRTSNNNDDSSASDEEDAIGQSNQLSTAVDIFSPFSSKETEKALRRETNSTLNRLKSIYYDSQFTQSLSTKFPHLVLVANERCGRWYIPSSQYHSSAYFKSTDGHYGQWSFNTRRPNLDFLKTIVANRGAVLVDSTRRGKRIPDALSKTVPVWCAVINRAVSKYEKGEEWSELCFPEESVSPQEVAAIRMLIPSFVRLFQECGVDISSISATLDRPLRPVFITPESSFDFDLPEGCYPVLLVTASKSVPAGYRRTEEGFMYVQGAADDEEAWSHGLTSSQFWENHKRLLECTQEEEVIRLIKEIVEEKGTDEMDEDVSRIGSTRLSLGVGRVVPGRKMIVCGVTESSEDKDANVLYLNIPKKQKPVTVLTQKIFPQAVTFAFDHGILNSSPITIIATDPSRTNLDLSISITLILLSLFINDNGQLDDRRNATHRKESIRTRLTWIITARGYQAERVSRQTLKIVNTYLMSPKPNTTEC